MASAANVSDTDPSRGRAIALRIVGCVLAAGALGGLFGIAVVIGWIDNEAGGIHRVHDLGGFGAWAGIILTPALAVQGWSPSRRVSSLQAVLAVGVAGAVAAALSADAGWLFAPVLVLVAAAVLLALHPARAEVFRTGRPSALLAVLTAAGAVPLVAFALSMAALQRNGPAGDPHVDMDHWAAMTTMAIAIVATGAVASLRAPGWRLTGWTGGLALSFFGLASVVYPDHAGSAGSGWGLAAIVGGLVFVAATEWESRRSGR
jgi:hypothetical protein